MDRMLYKMPWYRFWETVLKLKQLKIIRYDIRKNEPPSTKKHALFF